MQKAVEFKRWCDEAENKKKKDQAKDENHESSRVEYGYLRKAPLRTSLDLQVRTE